MKHSLRLVSVGLAALLAHPALSQEGQSQDDAGAQPNAVEPVAYAGQAITVTGTIESVDRETRTLSLKNEEARIITIRADEKMANFGELEKGNKVTVRYSEAILVSIASSDAGAQPSVETQTSTQAPAEGEPALRAVEHTRVVATVTDIAPDRSRITLQGPKDEEIPLRVRDPQAVANLKKGDAVIAAYVEALAVSVAPQDDAGQARLNEDAPIEAPHEPRAGEGEPNPAGPGETR